MRGMLKVRCTSTRHTHTPQALHTRTQKNSRIVLFRVHPTEESNAFLLNSACSYSRDKICRWIEGNVKPTRKSKIENRVVLATQQLSRQSLEQLANAI